MASLRAIASFDSKKLRPTVMQVELVVDGKVFDITREEFDALYEAVVQVKYIIDNIGGFPLKQ
jgi:hypothetical protein